MTEWAYWVIPVVGALVLFIGLSSIATSQRFAKVVLVGRLVVSVALITATGWVAWERPQTAMVWLAIGWMVWP